MNRILVLLVILSCWSPVMSQDRLKSKYFGTYVGKINSYKIETSGYLMDVNEVNITIELGPTNAKISIGKTSYSGTYVILFGAQDYYVLDVKLDDQPVPERLVVFKRGKKISRDGLFPQPNALLFKE